MKSLNRVVALNHFRFVTNRSISITSKSPYHLLNDTSNHAATCNCCNLGGAAALANGKNIFAGNISKKSFTTFDSLTTDDEHIPESIRHLITNNRKWAKVQSEEDPNFLSNLRSPQQPKYLYFGCSDSRVPANEILGLG
jgi:hypothetical protein